MEINCPSCDEAVLIADEDRGTKIECPFCQQRFALEKPNPLRIEKPPPPPPPPPPPRPKRPSVNFSFGGFITMLGFSSSAALLARFMMFFGFLTLISNFIKFFLRSSSRIYTLESKTQVQVLEAMRIDDCFTHCALGLIIAGFGMLIHQLDKKSKKVID